MKARAGTAIFWRRRRRIAVAKGPRPLEGRISPSSAASCRLGSSLSVIANARAYDRVDDVDYDVHQDKGEGHVAAHDGDLAQPLGARRAHVVLAEDGQSGGAGEPGHAGDAGQGDGKGGHDDPLVEGAGAVS